MRLDGQGRALTSVTLAAALAAAPVTGCGGDVDHGASAAISGAAAKAGCGGKSAVTAEGSTAQQNAIAIFNQVWGEHCPGKSVSYQATGSGAGRAQFIAGHVDFGGADSPLLADQLGPATGRCGGNPAWDLPLVFGPIALVYNLPGAGKLVVNADALGEIFSGRITFWNDRTLAALNPRVALPDIRIMPIYRADSSGTTDNLQKYLTAAAPQSWTRGVGTEFQGSVGEGVTQSAGVVRAVQTTPGAIGYVEKGFADQAGVPYADIDTGNDVVPLTADTAGNAIGAAAFVATGNDLVLDLNSMYASREPRTYPLILATYEIVCSKGYDPNPARAVKSFLAVAADNAQTRLTSAGYVPLPAKVKERLVTAIDAMQ